MTNYTNFEFFASLFYMSRRSMRNWGIWREVHAIPHGFVWPRSTLASTRNPVNMFVYIILYLYVYKQTTARAS